MRHHRIGTVATALAVVGLAVSSVGCGSDGGNSNEASSATQQTPKQEIDAVLQGLQRDFVKGRADAFCSTLTKSGQAQVGRFARKLGQGATCDKFVRTSYRMSKGMNLKQKPTKLVSLEVNGDTAVAMVSNGGRAPTPLRFVKQDGRWKVPDPGFAKAP